MNPNNVPQATLALANEHWRVEARRIFETTRYLTDLLPVIDTLGQSFVDDESDPQAEVRECVALVAQHTARFDDFVRALDALLLAFARLEADPRLRARIDTVRSDLLPQGMAVVTRSVPEKAAEGRLMLGRIDGDQRALLDELHFGDQTVLSFLEVAFVGVTEQLADAQSARLDAEERASHRSRGYNLATRRRFLRLDATVRNLIALNGDDPAVYGPVIGVVDRLFADAERRANARRTVAQRAGASTPDEAPADAADAAPVDGSSSTPGSGAPRPEAPRPSVDPGPNPDLPGEPGSSRSEG